MYHFISYTLFYVLNTQFSLRQLSVADFAIVAKDCLFWLTIVTSPQLICDITRTWGNGIVTSYSSIVLARAQKNFLSLINYSLFHKERYFSVWWIILSFTKKGTSQFDDHGVSSGWSSVWHRSNTCLSSTQYEQIPIILGVWPFWLTPFFFRSITFWQAYG